MPTQHHVGRYRSRYSQIQASSSRDLAGAEFGEATIKCWTFERDRYWGRYGQDVRRAVVLHFKVQASTTSEISHLTSFKIRLSFTGSGRAKAEDICLIGLPAPVSAEGQVHKIPGEGKEGTWRLESYLEEHWRTRHPNGAHWTWTTTDINALRGRIVYLGVALYHVGSQFKVTCHVEGTCSDKHGATFKFDGNHHNSLTWTMIPRVVEVDIQQHVEQLESLMKYLNEDSRKDVSIHQQPSNLTDSRTYASSSFQDSSRGHLGDEYSNCIFLSANTTANN